jgi:hypothetical protein
VRSMIYTTNAIESLSARLRRATRVRGHFPNETAASKALYRTIRTRDGRGGNVGRSGEKLEASAQHIGAFTTATESVSEVDDHAAYTESLTDSRRMALATPQNVIIGSISFLNIDDGAPPCDPIHLRTWKDAHGTRAPMRMATRTVELEAVLSSGRIRNRETVRAVVVFGGRLCCTELVPAIAATGNRNTATWTPTSVYEKSLAAGTDHPQVVSDVELHYVARPTS